MSHPLLDSVEAPFLKSQPPEMQVGDTVDVSVRIIEGVKERTQVFNGVVIARKGRGINASFTVRRIVANEGVERIFLIHSPRVLKVEVKRHGKVRRAKLYYLRDRVGKSRRLREKRSMNTKSALRAAAAKAAAASKKEEAEPVVVAGETA